METLHRGQGQCGVGQDGSRRPPYTLNLASCPQNQQAQGLLCQASHPPYFLCFKSPSADTQNKLTPEHLQLRGTLRVGRGVCWPEGPGFEGISSLVPAS